MFESFVPVIENDFDLLLTSNSKPQNSDRQPFSIGDTLWHGVAGRGLSSGIQSYCQGGTYDSFTMKS